MNYQIIRILLAIIFILCLFNFPYGFYQLVRFIGTIGFGVIAYQAYCENKSAYLFWGASALLINPFIKIPLGREIWNILDVIWAIALIVSAINAKVKIKS